MYVHVRVRAGECNIFLSQNRIMWNMLLCNLIFFNYKCIIFSCQYSVECSSLDSFTNLFKNKNGNPLSIIIDLILVGETDSNQIMILNHTNSEGKSLCEHIAEGT